MTKLTPINDRIIVDPFWPKNETKAGIIAPDGYERRPYRGTVIAVGPGRIGKKGQRCSMRCRAGMIIRFQNQQPLEYQIEVDRKKLFVMRDDDALAVEVADNEFYCSVCFDWVRAPHDCPAIKKQEKLEAPRPVTVDGDPEQTHLFGPLRRYPTVLDGHKIGYRYPKCRCLTCQKIAGL